MTKASPAPFTGRGPALPPSRRTISVGIIGLGTVGTGTVKVLVEHQREVERSQAARVNLGIEACVAGGTPVLHAIREGLAAENFVAVYGILNGTTNYILTEMERSGCDFREALAEAQEKGYAEPDPTFDVEGYDARYKVAILSMLCFGQPARRSEEHTSELQSLAYLVCRLLLEKKK